MIDRFDRYLSALWSRNGLLGIVVVVAMIVAICWLFGVDVGGFVNRMLGVQP